MTPSVKTRWLLTCWCILHIASSKRSPNIPYPNICECYLTNETLLMADCSNRKLDTFPEGIDKETQILDLSKNGFTYIPLSVSSVVHLEKLDFSENQIKLLSPKTLTNLTSLKILNLSKNQITSWTDINADSLLLPADNLLTLILSGNRLVKFSNLRSAEYLLSDSVETLDLSNCSISSVSGQSPIKGLPNIRHLILSSNPIRRVITLISSTLEYLDLSYCELSYIMSQDFNYLPALKHLVLSHNYRLIIASKYGMLNSLSVNHIDVSYCNMDRANISGLPNLRIANLRGNMIRVLESKYFQNNTKLYKLDLSSNAIGSIQKNSFEGMENLKILNLSVNVISLLNAETFSYTPNLTTLLLFRNHISNIGSYNSRSLRYLDLNMCEIQFLAENIFDRLPSIIDINLSKNWINNIPNNIKSNSLKFLDLSFNHISKIDNFTFFDLPELTVLDLSENSFTNTWKVSYFARNSKLEEIMMKGNTWRCDCFEDDMKELFAYLTNYPTKVLSTDNLICHSPSNVSDRSWFDACFYTWNPPSVLGENKKVLSYMFVIFCSFFGVFIVISLVRRVNKAKQRAAQIERERTAAESRERLREERMRRDQEAQINAPDPRDLVSPPSYDEALLMPRLDGSFHSLSGVGLNQSKPKKKARRRTRSSGDLLEEINSNNNRRNRRRKRSRGGHSSSPADTDLSDAQFINGSDGHIEVRIRPVQESDL